jgi:lysozyme family protein
VGGHRAVPVVGLFVGGADMTAPTPKDFLNTVISMWEGQYESYADDQGNYVTMPDGSRKDIGTMRGVTPNALAAHRGIEPWTLTPDDMQSVTLDEAVDIGYQHYYLDPHLDLLPWGPATAALLDFAWIAGPGQAVVSMQRLVGVTADGAIGPITARAYADWEASLGWAKSTEAIHDMRAAFYTALANENPADQQYLQGWLNRDDWASCADAEWWNSWGVT